MRPEGKNTRVVMLSGLVTAIEKRAELVEIVGSARTRDEAHQAVKDAFSVDDATATAILGMRIESFVTSELVELRSEVDALRVSHPG